MTRWAEFPLRPQGQPWPGLNTRGGRLDPGMGYLEDGSINAIINEADVLQKRKGLIRGLDERFDGVVCGLFRYTDECGIEYLLVASQGGIAVRTPFDIPTFLGTDSLPNDDFNGDLDTTKWTNTSDYETFLGALQLTTNAEATETGSVPTSRLMQWFKASAPTSYYVEIDYNMVAEGSGEQVCAVVIKRTGANYLAANVVLSSAGDYSVALQIVVNGTRTTLAEENLGGASIAEGFLRLSYSATSRTVTLRAIPTGGAQVTLTKVINELQASALGQNSAIGIAHAGEDQTQIEQVTGGTV